MFDLFFILFIYFPNDSIIRFNRKTRKVYFNALGYKKFFSWNFGRPKIQEFDWDDLRCLIIYPRFKHKHQNSHFLNVIAVFDKNTNKLIKFFTIAKVDAENDNISDEWALTWQWVCGYMAFKDEILEKKTKITKILGARKIKWSEDMDEKSKASSLDDYNRIITQQRNQSNVGE